MTMKFSSIAAFVLLCVNGAEAFGPVSPTLVKKIVFADVSLAGYLDQLEKTAGAAKSVQPKPKVGNSGSGYLDNLTAVTGGRPVLTGGGAGADTSAYGAGANGASFAQPPAPAPPATPSFSSSSPAAAAAAPTSGDYLSSLRGNTSSGTGAGIGSYTGTLGSNVAHGTGGAMRGFLSTLGSNVAHGTGAGHQSYTSGLASNAMASSRPDLTPPPSYQGSVPAEPISPPSAQAPAGAGGDYLSTLRGNTSTGTGSGMRGFLSTLSTNVARGTGAGQQGYTSGLASNEMRGTGAGTHSYTDTLRINAAGRSSGGYKSSNISPAAAFSPATISSDAGSEEYLNYLREATAAAKQYLEYLDGATKAAKDYLAYFEKAQAA